MPSLPFVASPPPPLIITRAFDPWATGAVPVIEGVRVLDGVSVWDGVDVVEGADTGGELLDLDGIGVYRVVQLDPMYI